MFRYITFEGRIEREFLLFKKGEDLLFFFSFLKKYFIFYVQKLNLNRKSEKADSFYLASTSLAIFTITSVALIIDSKGTNSYGP